MSSEWPNQPLGELAELIRGVSYKPTDLIETDQKNRVSLLRATNIGAKSLDLSDVLFLPSRLVKESQYVRKYDIVIAMSSGSRAAVGRLAQLRKEWTGTFGAFCGVVRPMLEKIEPEYLGYVLYGPDFRERIETYASGTAIMNLTREHLLGYLVKVPTKREQQEIAKILGTLDDRITLLRETNATLEAIAQALFKSWFVDFDPVHAKMQGRTPEGMDEATASLFPDNFEDSELGPVPKGWKLVPFGQLLSHTIGGDWGSDVADEKNDTRVAIIRGTDIPDLQANANNRVPVRYTSQKKLAGRKLEDGDLLLEVSGGSKDQPTGRSLYLSSGLLSQFDCPVEPASFCRLLRPVNKEAGVLLAQHLTYIYAQGKTWEYQNQSTGIANFQTTHFLETELVAHPPDDVLKVFAETVRPLLARSHLTQIQELASLRDTLLPRLISGQLRIEEAKEAMA
jgi:type I restriction enzyme S subunit